MSFNNRCSISSAIKYITFVFCFFCISLFAQNRIIDSLNQTIKTTKQDTTRCMALNDLGEYIFGQYPDSASVLWEKAVKLCTSNIKKTTNKKAKYTFSSVLARALMNCGTYYQSSLGPDAALDYFKKSMAVSLEIEDKEGAANCLLSIGNVYVRKGDLPQALDYYHKGLKIYEKINSPGNMAYCLGNIGNLYAELNDLDNALNYLNRSATIYEKQHNKKGLAFSLSGISAIYRDNGDPECKEAPAACNTKSKEKALTGYLKVLDLWSGENEPAGVGNACLNIASIYRSQGDLKKSLEYATRSFSLYTSLNNKQGMSASSSMLANLMFDKGDIKSAEEYGNKSMRMAKDIGSIKIMSSVSIVLKKIYEKQNNYKAALEMQELSIKMSDSLNNESIRKKSIKKQFEVEYEKQAEKDSILHVIKIEKAQIKHEQAIAQQRLYTLGGIVGFVLMLVVAMVSFRAYKTKQRANAIITQQSAKIEMANKDLERQHVLNQKIFSVISHDFRGPILSLNLVLAKFKDSSTNEKLNSYLKDIGTSVNNANAVLNNLLNWAKTEIAAESFDRSDCLIDDVIEKTENEFAEKLSEKKLQLIRRIPVGSIIHMPQDILQIAIRNLVSNAIKFSNTGGNIEISFDQDKRLLMIKDYGVGIAPEKLARLFSNQVNAALGTNKEEGFGIGLYIVSELLYKYGFEISVESNPGEGTAFNIKATK